jgi:hypothetical protein
MAELATELRGVSNAKAKRELGWEPQYPTWRTGFATAGSDEARAPLATGAR